MPNVNDNIETITRVISAFGGPSISPADLQWAADLPIGRDYLAWLAQKPFESVPEYEEPKAQSPEDSHKDEGKQLCDDIVAFERICLTDDELQIFKKIKGGSASMISGSCTAPPEYLTPRALNRKIDALNREADIFEQESASLRTRIEATKAETRRVKHAIKASRTHRNELDARNKDTEGRLENLSVQVDAAMAGAVKEAKALMDAFAHVAPAVEAQDALNLRTATIQAFVSDMRCVDDRAAHRPSMDEVQQETARLRGALSKDLINKAEEALTTRYLAKMLGSAGDVDTPTPGDAVSLDVENEVSRAWNSDVLEDLRARAAAFDAAIHSFEEDVLPPLQDDYDSQLSVYECVQEAEALIGTLCEELEDVADDADEATPNTKPATNEDMQSGFYEQLKDLVTTLKDLRPPDAPPLVLLDQQDVLDEVDRAVARHAACCEREIRWTRSVEVDLNKLSASHAPLMDVAYRHSPLDTSAPFSLPPDTTNLVAQGNSEKRALGDAVKRLQKDVEFIESDRTTQIVEGYLRRLGKQ